MHCQSAVDGEAVIGVFHITDAANKPVLVHGGNLLTKSAAGVVQITAAEQHMAEQLLLAKVFCQGHDADEAGVFDGLFVRDDYHRTSSFLQTAFLRERKICCPKFKSFHVHHSFIISDVLPLFLLARLS